MTWLELHQAVWTHRKTFELSALLGLEDTYAAAHVIRLWSWALDNAPDGDLSRLSARAIAYGAGWRGAAESFVRALVEVGWVDEDQKLHDWDEYAGKLVDRRAANAARMRAQRAQNVPGTSGEPSVNGSRTCGATVPNRTVPINRTGPDTTTSTPLPPPPQAEEGEWQSDGTILSVDPPTTGDVTLWTTARERLRSDMTPGNWDQLIAPLEPLGRAPDGGLRLRAPPGQGIGARVINGVRRALLDAGDRAAKYSVVVEQ